VPSPVDLLSQEEGARPPSTFGASRPNSGHGDGIPRTNFAAGVVWAAAVAP